MQATDTPNLLYLLRDPWPWGEPHETPRVHHAGRRFSRSVAVCSARARGNQTLPHRLCGFAIGRQSARTPRGLSELSAKRLELLKETLPGLTDVGVLLNRI